MRVVKIGGSLLARKGRKPRFEGAVFARLLSELRASGRPPDVLIHGAGAFGHNVASEADDPENIPPELVPRIRSAVAELSGHVASAMSKSRLSYCPMSPQELFDMERPGHPLTPFSKGIVAGGHRVMTWGDVAFERGRYRIYSGDEAAIDIARAVGGSHEFIFATDVPGIIDPGTGSVVPEFAEPMLRIFASSVGGGRPDVTGGMARKAARGLEIARLGHSVSIVSGLDKGALQTALRGGRVGTRIVAPVHRTGRGAAKGAGRR